MRVITDFTLYEVSFVEHPANPYCTVAIGGAVKGERDGRHE